MAGMSIDYYIYDFESTVADLSDVYRAAYSTTFRQFGISYKEEMLEEYMETPIDELFGRYYKGCTCKYRDFVMMFMRAFDEHFQDAHVRPGIAKTMSKLRLEGKKVGVISSCYEMYVRSFLSRYGLEDAVDSTVGMDRTAIQRPDPYVLKVCMADLGAVPERTVLTSGDRYGRTMAERAGTAFSEQAEQ